MEVAMEMSQLLVVKGKRCVVTLSIIILTSGHGLRVHDAAPCLNASRSRAGLLDAWEPFEFHESIKMGYNKYR